MRAGPHGGVQAIATMRDYMAPMDLMMRRVKKEVLEMLYNVDIEWELDEGWAAVCLVKGRAYFKLGIQ